MNNFSENDLMPVIGRTYSLFGAQENTQTYYQQINELTNLLLEKSASHWQVLHEIRQASKIKHYHNNRRRQNPGETINSEIIDEIKDNLYPFTSTVEQHLSTLPFFRKFDRTLSATARQYHFYMLEIELTNRLNIKHFNSCQLKLAFLPHCLRDLSRNCRAVKDEIDYFCKGCSKICFINRISRMLREKNITPYIWMSADLRRLFKRLKAEQKTVGVLGIACVVELMNGMRLCDKAHVPAIGVPLNANRCARWMGQFYDTSVSLPALEKLLGTDEASLT